MDVLLLLLIFFYRLVLLAIVQPNGEELSNKSLGEVVESLNEPAKVGRVIRPFFFRMKAAEAIPFLEHLTSSSIRCEGIL